jgi:hypothetical protein
VQKKYFPFLENLIVETALVFLPRFVLAITYIVLVSQTKIKGFAPSEPVTASFRFESTPNETMSSVCPLEDLDSPAPINLCFFVATFMTNPIAAAE